MRKLCHIATGAYCCFKRSIVSLIVVLLVHVGFQASSQMLLIDFDVDSATTLVGPEPISMSGSVGTIAGGSSGKGLAPVRDISKPKLDVEMDFTNADGYWDVSGIDVSADYKREEDCNAPYICSLPGISDSLKVEKVLKFKLLNNEEVKI